MKINLIYSEDCPHCSEVLEKLEKQGGLPDDELNLVKLESAEGTQLAAEVQLEEVPVALTPDKLKCEILYVDDTVEILCPGEDNQEDASEK